MGGSNFYKSRAKMRDLIESLIRKSMAGMDLAMDKMFALQPETYLRYEERFSELARLLECLQVELESVDSWGELDRIQRRVYFLEERFEDIDSVLRKRPRRSRSRFSMDNLFRVSQGGPGRSRSANGTDENGLSLEEACEVLGIDMTAKLPEIRKKVSDSYERTSS